jgi:curli biogenesis system outer membrane secretion channel CsgG
MRKSYLSILIVLSVIIYGCAGRGKESFNLAQELAKNDRLEEAIAMYEDARAKEPKNRVYAESLRKAKEAMSGKHLAKAKNMLAQKPLTHEQIRFSYQEAEKALSLTPKNQEAAGLAKLILSELDKMNKMGEKKYADALKAIEKNEWVEGIKNLRELNVFHPKYLDTASKLKQAENDGVSYYLKVAEGFKKDEDWEKVMKPLLAANEISPTRKEVIEALGEARLKHTPEYYLQKAEQCCAENNWDAAVGFARKAADIGLSVHERNRADQIKKQAAHSCLTECAQNLHEKKLYTAYSKALKAVSYDASLKNDPNASSVIAHLLGAMAGKAAAYDRQGLHGNAFVWYEKMMKIDQNYQDVFFKIRDLKDKIRDRVIRKIAVMDFSSPSGQADAGRIVTDNLLAYITAHSGGDIKILARDVLGAILKEIELGQAGLYDIESAKKAGKLQGTDVFIFGSVLNYQVEKNTTEGYKIENVVVGKRTIPNRAFDLWLMTIRGKPTREELQTAPPATIEEEIRETIRYKVGTERKRATVGVSFRVVDLEQGEVVITKTIKKSNEVKGDFSEGVPLANVKFQPLEILSDSELLEKVTQDVVAELSLEVVSRFQNLQMQYFNNADGLKKRKEYEKAIEKYIDAVHLEELKNISSPLSEKSRVEIDEVLKRIAS